MTFFKSDTTGITTFAVPTRPVLSPSVGFEIWKFILLEHCTFRFCMFCSFFSV